MQKATSKGKQRSSDAGNKESSHTKSRVPHIGRLIREHSSSSTGSAKSDESQLVDLVVEDHQAEEVDRVRARKEGGPGWNEVSSKHFV